MRIPLFKVGEKESIGEVLEARGIVRHDVGLARDVERHVVVAVAALVLTSPVAEIAGSPVAGDSTLADTGHGGGRSRWRSWHSGRRGFAPSGQLVRGGPRV